MEMLRRDFLKKALITYFGTVITQSTGNVIGKFVDTYWDSNKKSGEYNLDILKKLFGDFVDDYRFIPGISHYKFPGLPHPDDKEAMATLERLGAEVSKNFDLVNEVIGPKNHEGNLICLGSPMSNYISKQIMSYRNVSENNMLDGLIRIQDKSPFDLRFEYIFETAHLMKEGITRRYVGSKEHGVPNWSVRDNQTNDILIPKTIENNLSSDFLLISVLPNIFSQKAYSNKQRVIVIGGTHGVGTKSIELLFKNKTILETIVKKVGAAPYWQSLISISDTFNDQTTKRTVPRELSTEVLCSSVHIKEKTLSAIL